MSGICNHVAVNTHTHTRKRARASAHFDVHVKRPKFLSHFGQICFLLTDFHTSSQYQISRQFVDCKPNWHMQTDGRTDRHYKANSIFWRLMPTLPKISETSIRPNIETTRCNVRTMKR